MRRATFAATLLGALLAAPATARAQGTPTAGQVLFDNAFIGADGCSSTATPQHTVRVAWADQVDSSVGGGSTTGVFRIYATNTAPVAGFGGGGQYCQTVDNPNASPPVFAGQIGNDIPNPGTGLSGVASAVSTSQIADTAGYGACTQNGVAIYVCVHFYPYIFGTEPSPTPTAWAVGTMTLSLAVPSPVVLDQVLPGNGALNVSWTDNATPAASWYKVRALSLLDPAVLPTVGDFEPGSAYSAFDPRDPSPHETGYVSGTGPYRLSGLVNYVPYAVSVIAYSAAQTASDPSNVLSGAPQLVNDFWQTYKDAGGRETGGCTSGAAGPVGLGLLLATLALVRRRK